MRGRAGFVVGAASVLLVLLAVDACTPEQTRVARVAVPALTRAACVLIHGFAGSTTADTVCATAEDLAPFVGEILASRGPEAATLPVEGPFREVDASPERTGLVALAVVAELPKPKAPRKPRRRCVSWEPVASFTDGSASPEGHDAARGSDGAAAR